MLSHSLSTDTLCAAKCSPAFDLVSLSPHNLDSPNGNPQRETWRPGTMPAPVLNTSSLKVKSVNFLGHLECQAAPSQRSFDFLFCAYGCQTD